MLSMFHGSSHSLSNNLSSLFTLSGQTSYIAQAIALIVFNYAVGVALFLFAGIFIVRYVVIWVLVILSPLAFVAWILPATKILGHVVGKLNSMVCYWHPYCFFFT